MKKLLITALLLLSTSSFASLDKGVREATLMANVTFDLAELDPVGSMIQNKKSGEIVYNHCAKREKSQECTEVIHVLNTGDKTLVLHDRKGTVIKQNVRFIKERLDMSFRQSMLNFTDFAPNYKRSAGDFTGYIGMSCIYEPRTCALLVLLPLSIAADLVMLPVDATINESQRLKTRKQAQLFMKNLRSEEEVIVLSNREFKSMLKGLSQF
jgi:hypothetical protein